MHQVDADELASGPGTDQDYDGGEDGYSTDGSIKRASGKRCWATRGDKASAPPRARCVARGARGDRRRRDGALNAMVRVPGHDRRRPYNNFHRFLRVRSTNLQPRPNYVHRWHPSVDTTLTDETVLVALVIQRIRSCCPLFLAPSAPFECVTCSSNLVVFRSRADGTRNAASVLLARQQQCPRRQSSERTKRSTSCYGERPAKKGGNRITR